MENVENAAVLESIEREYRLLQMTASYVQFLRCKRIPKHNHAQNSTVLLFLSLASAIILNYPSALEDFSHLSGASNGGTETK